MVQAQTPTIAKIRTIASLTEVRALVSIAICEVCDFVNVGKNMNDIQVALTADMIISSYNHLKLEEIKYCFRRAMCTEKLFDRLDGNIILGWLHDYDMERTIVAMQCPEKEDCAHSIKEDSITWNEYILALKTAADGGDNEARKKLEDISQLMPPDTNEPDAKKNDNDEEFKQWLFQSYLNGNHDNGPL